MTAALMKHPDTWPSQGGCVFGKQVASLPHIRNQEMAQVPTVSSISSVNASNLRIFVRIFSLPADKILEGLDVSRFEVGQTYEMGPHLAELLIRAGCATLERRKTEQRISQPS